MTARPAHGVQAVAVRHEGRPAFRRRLAGRAYPNRSTASGRVKRAISRSMALGRPPGGGIRLSPMMLTRFRNRPISRRLRP
jgi:hypothetical protein